METSGYVLNERLKRIEPNSKKCSFCYDGTTESINDCYFVPVFKENDRTNIVVYRSVKYSKIDIGIPRCTNCKAIHQASKKRAAVLSSLGALVVIAFTIYNFLDIHPIVSVLLLFLSAFIGFGGYAFLQNTFTRKAGINTLKEGAENDAMVQDFLIKGWSLTQPSA